MNRFGSVENGAVRRGRGSAVIPLRRRGGAGARRTAAPGAAARVAGAAPGAASPETAAPGAGTGSRAAVRRVRVDVYRLAIAITLIYFIVTAINQELVLTQLNRQLGSLESELETVRVQQAVLRERIAYLESDSYIVQEARGRFGMAHPGEIRYVIVEDGEAGAATGDGHIDQEDGS